MGKSAVHLILRRLPTIEVVAQQMVRDLATCCTQMVQAQADILEELGQTEEQREQVMRQIASQCYRDGTLPSFPRRLLWSLVSEQDLHTMALAWMRHVPDVVQCDQCIRLLKQRPEVPYACTTVPEVSPVERRTDRRAAGIRTRRDPRRTHRCDERPMSAHNMPA